MVSMLLLPCALPHARVRILGLHRHRTNLRSFPRKRESRGRELGQRTGSPRPRGRAELKGDSNSDNFDLALYLKGAVPPSPPEIKIAHRRGKYPFAMLASALSASPTHHFLCSPTTRATASAHASSY